VLGVKHARRKYNKNVTELTLPACHYDSQDCASIAASHGKNGNRYNDGSIEVE